MSLVSVPVTLSILGRPILVSLGSIGSLLVHLISKVPLVHWLGFVFLSFAGGGCLNFSAEALPPACLARILPHARLFKPDNAPHSMPD